MRAEELLLHDLDQAGETARRNEAVGEQRLTVFVTLSTAVGAGLAALAAAGNGPGDALFANVASASAVLLLLVGVLNYLRMLQRNAVRDQLDATQDDIRRTCVALCPDLVVYEIRTSAPSRLPTWLRGGYAETFAAFDGLLSGLLLVTLVGLHLGLAALVGVTVTAVLWWWSAHPPVLAEPAVAASTATGQPYHAGVGAVVTGVHGRVLTAESSDAPGRAHLPRTLVAATESTSEAVTRCLSEHFRIAPEHLEFVAALPDRFIHEFPTPARTPATGRGRVETWFVYRLAQPTEVRLPRRLWRTWDEILDDAPGVLHPSYEALHARAADALAAPPLSRAAWDTDEDQAAAHPVPSGP
jgi:ADP-ribose pyrophosphatase YjhB (NUDIX family)